ncbi:MAG: methyltransferase RsmF C-terminal domain-like protein [Ruminococcus sp.]|jgi:NOL1/NOP2/fmu family ribosome biogenesis protein
MKKDRFEPSQALAMYLKVSSFPAVMSLPYEDYRVMKYLKGETLDTGDFALDKGWHLVCLEEFPLGWGKIQNHILKNKRYSGWRWQ